MLRSSADGGPARTAVLRGQRSCADSARGTCPSGLPFSAAAGMGTAINVFADCPARQKDGGRGGQMRQNFFKRIKYEMASFTKDDLAFPSRRERPF